MSKRWMNDNESSVIWYQIGCGRRASASGASGSCANMSESVKINQARDTGHSTNYPNPNRRRPAKGPRQLGAVSRQKAWQGRIAPASRRYSSPATPRTAAWSQADAPPASRALAAPCESSHASSAAPVVGGATPASAVQSLAAWTWDSIINITTSTDFHATLLTQASLGSGLPSFMTSSMTWYVVPLASVWA